MPYSEITISAPSSASHSNVVNFGIGIKNTITTPGMIAWRYRVYCWAPDQMPESLVLYDEVDIAVGAVKIYTLAFFMPNKNAEIFVWVERLKLRIPYPSEWPYDSSKLHKVSLAVAPPPAEFRDFALTEYTRR